MTLVQPRERFWQVTCSSFVVEDRINASCNIWIRVKVFGCLSPGHYQKEHEGVTGQ